VSASPPAQQDVALVLAQLGGPRQPDETAAVAPGRGDAPPLLHHSESGGAPFVGLSALTLPSATAEQLQPDAADDELRQVAKKPRLAAP
jgi:hypothetical protein